MATDDARSRWAESVPTRLSAKGLGLGSRPASAQHLSLPLKTKRPSSAPPLNVLEDYTYEVSLFQVQSKLPPVTLPPTPRDENAITGSTPRTPHEQPRTPPASPKWTTQPVEDKAIKKRRSDFFVYDLLMDMNFENIVEMKQAFAEAGGGVTLPDFVKIMRRAIPHKRERENEIINKLCDLFAEIDIDNDKEMTWDEFTSFIIKSGVEPYDPTTSMKRYQEIKPAHPISFQGLNKLKYVPQIDRLIVCENNKQCTVRVFKPETMRFQTEFTLVKELGLPHSPSPGHTGAVFCAEFMDNKNYLITSGADSKIIFWDVEVGYRQRGQVDTTHPQLSMVWSAPYNTLFTGDTVGNVRAWSPVTIAPPPPDKMMNQTGTEKLIREKAVYKGGHTDMVTSLVTIPNTPLLASASLDGTINIWDINVGSCQRTLKGHIKGVFALAYSHEHRFLMSAGSDRDALVWNPMVKSKPIFRLKGHHSSLIGIEILEGTPQVITADLDGVFRLWDIRTFECIQTFEPTHRSGEFAAFACTGSHNQVVAGGYRGTVFEYDKPGIPWLSMDSPIVAALYNSNSATILTAGGDTIKIWDAKSGKMLRTYSGLTQIANNDSISSVCLDSNQRKIIVGDTEGIIQVLNYSNGAILRRLDAHTSVISELIYCSETSSVISASWDNSVAVHDELDSEGKGRSVLRTMGHRKDVLSTAYSESLSLVASGTADGFVWVWDFEKCGFEAKLEQNAEEVTAIQFMHPYPIMCTADNRGALCLWTVKPAPNKYHLIGRFENTHLDSTSAQVATGEQEPDGADHVSGWEAFLAKKKMLAADPSNVLNSLKILGKYGRPGARDSKYAVHSMVWNSESHMLYTGDEKGCISQWSFEKFFKEKEVLPVRVTKSSTRRKAVRYGDQKELQPQAYRAPKIANSNNIIMVSQWKAHHSAITSLQLIDNPSSLLSSSLDKRVRVWGLDGRYYGTLRQAPQGGKWRFPMDEEGRKKAEAKKVDEIVTQIESKEKPKKSVTIAEDETEEERREAEVALMEKQREVRQWARKGIKKPRWGNNSFYDFTRARMRAGDPDLNKFNPNQPGQFPVLIQGLPFPERMSMKIF